MPTAELGRRQPGLDRSASTCDVPGAPDQAPTPAGRDARGPDPTPARGHGHGPAKGIPDYFDCTETSNSLGQMIPARGRNRTCADQRASPLAVVAPNVVGRGA